MTDLRAILRTMYPPVLADRGLDGALTGLAGKCAIPTTVEIQELGRLPASVEAAAYFVVTEALTNATKHSGASWADVRVHREAGRLVVKVTDGGVGGAEENEGTGVGGMRDRIAALDGELVVVSPQGGPTVVAAELPCAW